MSEFLSGLAAWAWEASLFGAALVLGVLLVQRLFGGVMSPRWRYGLGLLVLARLLLPVAPESALSVSNLVPRAPATDVPVPEVAPVMPAPAPRVPTGEEPFVLPHAELPVATVPLPEPFVVEAPVVPSGHHFDPMALLPWLWLVGVGVVLGWAIWKHRRLVRWERRVSHAPDPRLAELFRRCGGGKLRLVEVPGLHTAALVGLWRPRVLVPEGMVDKLSEEEIGHVFAHELGHWRHRDLWVNWLVVGAQALHWFNPLAWFGLRRMLADRELARDAQVVRGAGSEGRARYGRTLIKILETFQPARLSPGAAPVLTNKPEIRRRITMIAKTRWNSRLAGTFCLLLAACLGMATFTSARADDDEKGERDRPRENERGDREGERDRERRDREGERDRERGDRERDEREGERDRERGERDRERGDRERGEREGERDREHGDRERDERHGERDREGGEREGERHRDREHAEREGERRGGDDFERRVAAARERVRSLASQGKIEEAERLEREIAEAMRRRAGDRERGDREREGERRERDGDEFERHIHELKEKVGWLAERERHEEAEKVERHIHELLEHRERAHRDSERKGDEFEHHVRELKQKVAWLAEHGKHEEAEKLEHHIHELLERHHHERDEHAHRDHGHEHERADHLEARLHEMAKHMEEMHRAMQEMRRELERLRKEGR